MMTLQPQSVQVARPSRAVSDRKARCRDLTAKTRMVHGLCAFAIISVSLLDLYVVGEFKFSEILPQGLVLIVHPQTQT